MARTKQTARTSLKKKNRRIKWAQKKAAATPEMAAQMDLKRAAREQRAAERKANWQANNSTEVEKAPPILVE